jgi:probable rRNA maturation factor
VSLSVAVSYGTRNFWAPSAVRLAAYARAAAPRARGQLDIRVVTPRESRRLNRRYRGHDRPTNVLSFPAASPAKRGARMLGDLAICAAVVRREALAQDKRQAAHWAHMIVHGTLHLLGYDHAQDRDAARMERRERAVLARLGFPDPYGTG